MLDAGGGGGMRIGLWISLFDWSGMYARAESSIAILVWLESRLKTHG